MGNYVPYDSQSKQKLFMFSVVPGFKKKKNNYLSLIF